MSFLTKMLNVVGRSFEKGKPLSKFYPVFEALDSFVLTTGKLTEQPPHVRDYLDLKRVMSLVVVSLLPCFFFGVYNVGYQILTAQGEAASFSNAFWLGLTKVMPLMIVIYAAGGFWEVLFAVVRRHEINEGFLVTGFLFTLILPPTMPLWQAAAAISFGVVIGKEIFGGVGYNILNPALTARVFAFFAYPAQMSGNSVWVALDGYTKATPLAVVAEAARGSSAAAVLQQAGYSFHDAFWGFIPGSIGETSTAACLLGLGILLMTGIASWRIVAGCAAGLMGAALLFVGAQGPGVPGSFSLPPEWHLVLGGFAFGSIFMATDPVTASATNVGKWIYGICIGVLVVLIRVVNPAYPEGVMLAILFMNIFAPLIDHVVVEAHVRGRRKRLVDNQGGKRSTGM